MIILILGWMIASFIIRKMEIAGIESHSSLATWYLHHGLWLALLPISWVLLSTCLMKNYSRWLPFVVFVGGPTIAISFIILAAKAAFYGVGGGVIVGGP